MSILRRVRAAIGMGLSWAAVWGVAGVIASPLLRIFAHAGGDPISIAAISGLTIGWYGFLAGTAFSVVLSIAGRRRSVDELRTSTIGMWGLTASILLTAPPFIVMVTQRGWRMEDAVYLAGSLLLSSGCAIGTLLIARRALPRTSSDRAFPNEVPFAAHPEGRAHDRVASRTT